MIKGSDEQFKDVNTGYQFIVNVLAIGSTDMNSAVRLTWTIISTNDGIRKNEISSQAYVWNEQIVGTPYRSLELQWFDYQLRSGNKKRNQRRRGYG